MNRYNFSDEEISKILLSSPMALPNNPSGYGLTAGNVKPFFYNFIRRLMLLINEHFILIERDKESAIGEHNLQSEAHKDIRMEIDNLKERETELGDAISEHYGDVHKRLEDERTTTNEALSDHNNDSLAHAKIRNDVSEIRSLAQSALSFAQGKSRIIPVRDEWEMINSLNSELNVGDKFVLLDKNVPDFTLFEKNSTNKDAFPLSQAHILTGAVTLIPGESYLCNGYLLVASESGLDTSKLAKSESISALEEAIATLDNEITEALGELILSLDAKESSLKMATETAQTFTLQNKTVHNAGLRTVLNLQLDEEIPTDFECIVNFRSGITPTVFGCDSRIKLTQDDCYKGVLTPFPNRIYEINIKNVDGVIIAKVGCCDCQE